MTRKVIVIGAGVGGLSAAAYLARAGMDVTVLEANVYPGGCAGTFYHQGFRFDAGATLAAGFYPGGPMDRLAEAAGIQAWPARPTDTAMMVHLLTKEAGIFQAIPIQGGEERWATRRIVFGPEGERFFRWQEQTADSLWSLAIRQPAWPPTSFAEAISLGADSLGWLIENAPQQLRPDLLRDAFRPVAAHLKDAPESLRLFVDAQLLISAQTTSQHANALYGSAALDLARRGVVHLVGGMGAVSHMLVQAVRSAGGQVLYRQKAGRIRFSAGRPVAVETKRGDSFPADLVIANLTPPGLFALYEENVPRKLKPSFSHPKDGWGAFMVYLGVDEGVIPDESALHHQIVNNVPLGEGNSLYLSISPEWDASRAPAGKRAITISTHTRIEPWWELYENNQQAYEAQKALYTERILQAAEKLFPGLREAAGLILPGTPITFQRFTHRPKGWVGGFPQVSLFRGWAPRLSQGVWMVGDSIFPGQSVPAVALGGLRVGKEILESAQSRAQSLRRRSDRWNLAGDGTLREEI